MAKNRSSYIQDYLYGAGTAIFSAVTTYFTVGYYNGWTDYSPSDALIPGGIAVGFGIALVNSRVRRRGVIKRLKEEMQQNPSYNPFQQNLESNVDQYTQLTHNPQQAQPYQSSDLSDRIAQVKREIQELESN